jgi:hypothetical protein
MSANHRVLDQGGQVRHPLSPNAAREGAHVVTSWSADLAAVIGIGEQVADRLVHAVDNDDLRLCEAALGKLFGCAVLQAAEQPVLAAPGPVTRIS